MSVTRCRPTLLGASPPFSDRSAWYAVNNSKVTASGPTPRHRVPGSQSRNRCKSRPYASRLLRAMPHSAFRYAWNPEAWCRSPPAGFAAENRVPVFGLNRGGMDELVNGGGGGPAAHRFQHPGNSRGPLLKPVHRQTPTG